MTEDPKGGTIVRMVHKDDGGLVLRLRCSVCGTWTEMHPEASDQARALLELLERVDLHFGGLYFGSMCGCAKTAVYLAEEVANEKRMPLAHRTAELRGKS
jgi:hypothetical protein